jgi:hypothetical protein
MPPLGSIGLPEDEKVRMVLAGMNLFEHTADARFASAHHDKQVFTDEADRRQLVDDFHMCEPLLVGAHFILALHDAQAFRTQDPPGFAGAVKVQVQNSFVVLLFCPIAGLVVPVIALIVLMPHMSGSTRRVHVGGIENEAIHGTVAIRQLSAVNSVLQISGQHSVLVSWHVSPKDPIAVGDIGNGAAGRDVKGQHVREYFVVCALVGREDQFIGRDASRRFSLPVATG